MPGSAGSSEARTEDSKSFGRGFESRLAHNRPTKQHWIRNYDDKNINNVNVKECSHCSIFSIRFSELGSCRRFDLVHCNTNSIG